jgi:hypothetical protein
LGRNTAVSFALPNERLPSPRRCAPRLPPNEPVAEPIPEYHDMLREVRSAFVEMDVYNRAMAQDPSPRRLVLGNGAYGAVIDELERTLVDIRANETLSRGADFPD